MKRPSTRVWALAGLALVITTAVACSGDKGATPSTTVAPPAVETTTTTEVPIEAGDQIFVYEPAIGDCFDLRKLDEPSSTNDQVDIVLKVDCALPHRFEVFDVLQYPNEFSVFPGDPALETFANQNCVKSFEAYVGKSYELSELQFGYYTTPKDQWDSGPQTFACTLYQSSNDPTTSRVVGSFAGSGR